MKFTIPIRIKMLATTLAVLGLAIGAYLYLATSLFTEDKLAYVYDLNASLVGSLSEQTRSNLETFSDRLGLFARDAAEGDAGTDAPDTAAADLFARDEDILRVELYARPGPGQPHARRGNFVRPDLYDRTGLDEETLADLRGERPLPLEAIASEEGSLFLANSSLPPDAAVLTLGVSARGSEGDLVIVADFLHRRLLRLFAESKLHTTFLVNEAGEVLAHPDPEKVIGRASLGEHPLLVASQKARTAEGAVEFTAEDGVIKLGAYAPVGAARLVVLSEIPRDEALRAARDLVDRSVFFGIGIFIAAFMASIVFSRLLTAPISQLREAAAAIGKGRFDGKTRVKSRDEIGELARSFESMAGELKDTQTQLVFSEKMAAFGQLGAGITHEVKNPITGIIGFAQLGKAGAGDKEKAQEFFSIIEQEGKRCSEILINFLKFVRQDTDEVSRLEVNETVGEICKIVNHQLMINRVQLKTELGDRVPPIMGNAAKLQQVLLNLSINAQQAMSKGGAVTIATSRGDNGNACIAVSDNGPGIPDDVRDKIFDPFFTTKEAGEGTGLGLSIVFGIVRDHGGKISVESGPETGTTFLISLPPAPDR